MSVLGHRLERIFNAPIDDILEAIEHGFRAQVDVRGKLAELYLSRYFDSLVAEAKIDSFNGTTWMESPISRS
ncbi:MAG: hypothetical protein ACREQE_02725 [Candidatus Binataceae bacterium]